MTSKSLEEDSTMAAETHPVTIGKLYSRLRTCHYCEEVCVDGRIKTRSSSLTINFRRARIVCTAVKKVLHSKIGRGGRWRW